MFQPWHGWRNYRCLGKNILIWIFLFISELLSINPLQYNRFPWYFVWNKMFNMSDFILKSLSVIFKLMVRKKIMENLRHEKPYFWRKGKLNEKISIPTLTWRTVSFFKTFASSRRHFSISRSEYPVDASCHLHLYKWLEWLRQPYSQNHFIEFKKYNLTALWSMSLATSQLTGKQFCRDTFYIQLVEVLMSPSSNDTS